MSNMAMPFYFKSWLNMFWNSYSGRSENTITFF